MLVDKSHFIPLIQIIMKLIFKILLLAILIMGINTVYSQIDYSKNLKTGDIIFQDFNFGLSQAIKIITKSEYSHVGMIIKKQGKTYVLEAVQPVRLSEFNEWISRNPDSLFVVKRLINRDSIITPKIEAKIEKELTKYLNKDYDIKFGWSDEKMYCSELVWKLYKNAINIEVGKLDTLGNYDFSNDIVRKKLDQIYGGNIPYNEIVISPQAIFESKKLFTILEK